MSIETVRSALLWCSVIDYALLLLWVVIVIWAHDWLFRLNSRWFRLSVEQFDAMQYGGIVLFKLGILLFNVVPLVALYLVR